MNSIWPQLRKWFAKSIWPFIEPVVEHAANSVIVTVVTMATSGVLTILLPPDLVYGVHRLESFAYAFVAALFTLHTLAVLVLRTVSSVISEWTKAAHSFEERVGLDGDALLDHKGKEAALIGEGTPTFMDVTRQIAAQQKEKLEP
jgi:hypothetical protein